MPTNLEINYTKINNQILEIQTDNDYPNKSVAFGHFFIKTMFNVDDQTASESITDGGKDNGIDAIFISNDDNPTIYFFQFKFPSSPNTINKGFTEEEVVKLGNGVLTFFESSNLDPNLWNEDIIEKYEQVKSYSSYSEIKLCIVRYTPSQPDSSDFISKNELLKSFSKRISEITLNTCSHQIYSAKEIIDLYVSKYENIFPTIKLKIFPTAGTSQIEINNYRSIHTLCTIKNFYEAISPHKDTIFEGNVRFYNPNTEVTKSIRDTLSSNPKNFLLFNNGITILTKKAEYNSFNGEFTLKSATIINGAQTSGCIIDVLDNELDSKIYEESILLVRILEIHNDEPIINDIVNSLNNQTKMYSAFQISRDSRLQNIQNEINTGDYPYFLEIKSNEFETLKRMGLTKKSKKYLVNSEKIIQLYTAYYNLLDKASLAKTNSSELLKHADLVEKALDKLSTKDILHILDLYTEITTTIKKYKSYKRNTYKTEILDYLEIDTKEINNYQFLSTSDILILFSAKIISDIYPCKNFEYYIKFAIKEIYKYMKKMSRKEKVVFSNLTKSKFTFDELKRELYKKQKNIK